MSRRVPPLHIGIDEAGLGPTLGPLVIAGLATRGPRDLRLALAAAISDPGAPAPTLEVGDSKIIYTGKHKLARLERSALATWMWAHDRDEPPTSARELLASAGEGGFEREPAPWFDRPSTLDDPLPRACDPEALAATARQLRRVAAAAGVRPLAYRADVITAARFNRELGAEVEAGGTKNSWVVARTLALAGDLMALEEGADDAPAELRVVCDKAGGRDDYGAPLARAFPSRVATELERGRARSTYALHGLLERSAEAHITFAMKADRLEPRVSLASCLAKYLRELVMDAFNAWFLRHQPALRATAGYPADARRFIEESAPTREAAQLEAAHWIRCR